MSSNTESGKRPIVALTGFMAAGKSTIGRTLGAFLHWHFVDLDCEIESRSQLRIHEIFSLHGESRFRELEAEALRSIVEHNGRPTVIALGGGTFIQPDNAEFLRDHGAHVVFLELAVEESLYRCRLAARSSQNPRPLASSADSDPDIFRALYEQRLPHYRRARLTVRADNKTADEVAREIAAALHLTGPVRHGK